MIFQAYRAYKSNILPIRWMTYKDISYLSLTWPLFLKIERLKQLRL